MSATLICTEQGKRLHIGIYYSSYWSPICAQSSGDIYLVLAGASAAGRNRKPCVKCMKVGDQVTAKADDLWAIYRSAASTEER
jgi:hypothetical protein